VFVNLYWDNTGFDGRRIRSEGKHDAHGYADSRRPARLRRVQNIFPRKRRLRDIDTNFRTAFFRDIPQRCSISVARYQQVIPAASPYRMSAASGCARHGAAAL
jgi:hypothetical protein